ncbi:uncharacterized protein LACBIDRAFT_309305 [Laccaria bicolor S238N-H82]|uniref:Predicted protein n=1 Tax=Laccaria bicolor (strain S238N-H82 / ATCC MYA-4686) TaxID=486041 RepID=B0CW23_LACBS|nr:uncharacterized protein LACBIDRAFT_309305 [Laccaria bicolor S238N-H82]EDR13436.1 predicted protein [Laccaria bicolor S238N-H82]|eukprot:XP_001875934.1 predicted protein [Laccaria bicolor S238N-H82]
MSFISAGADVIFYHGMTLQRFAEWDSGNRSSYATCAENPRPSFGFARNLGIWATFLLENVKCNVEG